MPTTSLHRSGRWAGLALAAVLAMQLMLQLDLQVVTVALPQVQTDLGFSTAGLSWIPNAYALAFGGLLLLGGRLGDVFGRVRVFQGGTILFSLASVLGGLSQSPTDMVTARVLQGIGAAVAAPSILALITSMARDEAARNKGLALFTAASAVGSSFGLILGGLLTSVASWRWALFINLPVGIAVVVTIHLLVAETPRTRGGFDVLGALFATGGSLALVHGFIHAAESTWTSLWTILSFVLAAALLGLFALNEHRVRHPLLKPALLRDRARSGALAIMALVVGAHFAMLFMVVQYYQHVLDFGPLKSGFAFLPLTGTVLVLTQFMPRLQARFGARSLTLVGTLLVTASFFGFAALDSGSTYAAGVLPALLVHSVGVAMVFVSTTVVIMSGLEADDAGSMSGLLQTAQQVGGSLGIAIIVAVHAVNHESGPHDSGSFASGLGPAFYVAAAMTFAAGLLALVTLIRPTAKPTPTQPPSPISDDEHHLTPATAPGRRK